MKNFIVDTFDKSNINQLAAAINGKIVSKMYSLVIFKAEDYYTATKILEDALNVSSMFFSLEEYKNKPF